MPEGAFERVVVIGDGGWGTTLALTLLENGLDVRLWSPFVEQAEELRARRENERYLPGVHLPEELMITADPSVAIKTYFAPQGVGADTIATKWGFSRDDVDAYAMESQKRAAKAWEEGRFAKSIVPVKDQMGGTILDHDEHMRPQTDMQSLAARMARAGIRLSLNVIVGLPGESAGSLVRYACCYYGLFTGPFCTYETWLAAMRSPRRPSRSGSSRWTSRSRTTPTRAARRRRGSVWCRAS